MMHDPENQKKLGKLRTNPTKEKRINVLQHLYGYFKKSLSKKEALLLRRRIEVYAKGFAT